MPLYHKVLAYEEQIGDCLTMYMRDIDDQRRAVVNQEFLELAHQRLSMAYGGTPSDVDLDPLIQIGKVCA